LLNPARLSVPHRKAMKAESFYGLSLL